MQYCTSSEKKIRDEYMNIRRYEMNMKSTEKYRNSAKTIRAAKNSYGDKIVEKEGETYVLGGF